MVTAIWRDKRALHTAVHSHDPQAQHDAQDIAARLNTSHRQLREWHVRGAKELAQEQQCYFQNPQPYKCSKHVDKVLGETGYRGIKAVRLQDGTVRDGPKVVLDKNPQQLPTPTQHRGQGVPRIHGRIDITFAETLQTNTATRHAPHPIHYARCVAGHH